MRIMPINTNGNNRNANFGMRLEASSHLNLFIKELKEKEMPQKLVTDFFERLNKNISDDCIVSFDTLGKPNQESKTIIFKGTVRNAEHKKGFNLWVPPGKECEYTSIVSLDLWADILEDAAQSVKSIAKPAKEIYTASISRFFN